MSMILSRVNQNVISITHTQEYSDSHNIPTSHYLLWRWVVARGNVTVLPLKEVEVWETFNQFELNSELH